MKKIWWIVFVIFSCSTKKDFYSKVELLDTANPDTYIILIEQEGKDIKDAQKRALENAIDKASYMIIKSNYEKITYEEQKGKIYQIKDIIIGQKELEKDKNRIKISFVVSKSKLRDSLIKNGIARKNITYKSLKFVPFILVKNHNKDCQNEVIELMKPLIKEMITKIGARMIEKEDEKEETIPVDISPEAKECILYECDLLIEMNTKCSNGFYTRFEVYDPIVSHVIEEESISLEFSKKLTNFDIIDEGIYRIFSKISEKYEKYMDSITGPIRLIYIEMEKENAKEIEDKLTQKLNENQIYITKKIQKDKGLFIVVSTRMNTEEIGFIIPYILSEDIKLNPAFQNRKFIHFQTTN